MLMSFPAYSVHRDVTNRVSLLSMRPSMVRAQADNRPNIPHSFEELHEILTNHAELGRTYDGQMELYQGMSGVPDHRSIVFASRRVLDGVADLRYIFSDATFFSRPNSPNSSQLFTLVTVRDNHVRNQVAVKFTPVYL